MPLDEAMAAAIEKQKKMHYLENLTISIEILSQIYISLIFVIKIKRILNVIARYL
jgi:hypothetical protein